MFEVWTVSKTWGTRPSVMCGITDEVAAYCFDRAVTSFGLSLEADIEEGTHKAKNRTEAKKKAMLILDRWLREPSDRQVEQPKKLNTGKGFNDPAKLFKKE